MIPNFPKWRGSSGRMGCRGREGPGSGWGAGLWGAQVRMGCRAMGFPGQDRVQGCEGPGLPGA